MAQVRSGQEVKLSEKVGGRAPGRQPERMQEGSISPKSRRFALSPG